jgi:hypothetical protein
VWLSFDDIEAWWCSVVLTNGGRRKDLTSLHILVSWKLLNERNARIFKNKSTMPSKKNLEAISWVLVGVKHLAIVLLGE